MHRLPPALFLGLLVLGTGCPSADDPTALARTTPPAAKDDEALLDPDFLTAEEFLRLPFFSAKMSVDATRAQPFLGPIAFDRFLENYRLTPTQRRELYAKVFVRVDLDRATEEELLLVPGAGPRIVREIRSHRPWRNWDAFEIELSQSVDQDELARLRRYCFLPVDANNGSERELREVPRISDRAHTQILALRPFPDRDDFVERMRHHAGEKEVLRIARYLDFH